MIELMQEQTPTSHAPQAFYGLAAVPCAGCPSEVDFHPFGLSPRTTAICVRREKAALSSGCKSHPANAPAGSNRSSHGGNEMAEAFGVAGHI